MENYSRSISEKNIWTFNWQKTHLAPLLKNFDTWYQIKEFWTKYRFLNAILERVIINTETKLLDVGYGLTSVLNLLHGRCICLDPLIYHYSKLINYPKSFYLIDGYGEFIPISNNSINLVFCSNCIDHVFSPKEVLQEIGRILKDGGYLILTCEIYEKDIGQRNIGHPHTFTAEKLRNLIEEWKIIGFWKSPWIGIYNFLIEQLETSQEEHIYLIQIKK